MKTKNLLRKSAYGPFNTGQTQNPTFRQFRGFLRWIVLAILAMNFFFSSATHVVGGGITYTHLEGNSYLLTLKLYRDCSPGTFPLAASVDVEVRQGDGTAPAVSSFNLPLIDSYVMAPGIPPCVFDPGICVEEAIYQDIVSLSPGTGGYHLYFTICCRNATIANINSPLTARETYYAYVPDNNIWLTNSSPVFNMMPPVYVCMGEDLNLDCSATDPDGDVLVYTFYTPFDGFSGAGITYTAATPPNNINISPVTWLAGFGATDPLDPAPGLLPGLAISTGGLITGTPAAPGQFVVGVMIDEYRDGVLIGRITRDFQFNVLNCPPPIDAAFSAPDVCNGLTVDFDNTSGAGATTFWWDFGTGDPADSSLVFEPTFTYAAAGVYTVTLIVQKGTNCADTATFTFEIMDPLTFTITVDSVNCSGTSTGSASVVPADGTLDYVWSTASTAYSISGLTVGAYWLEATNGIGCIDTQFFNLAEPGVLGATFVLNEPLCHDSLNGSIVVNATGGTAPFTYTWLSPSVAGPVLSGIGTGPYSVLIVDANGCSGVFNTFLAEPAPLIISPISLQDVNCYGGNDGEIEIAVSGGTMPYGIDWPTIASSGLVVDDLFAGSYPVVVTDDNGCIATVTFTVSQPPVFSVSLVIVQPETCSDANGILQAVITGGFSPYTFSWTPSVSTTAVATGLSAGTYDVLVTDDHGCVDTSTVLLPDEATGDVMVADLNPVSCPDGEDGSITVAVMGGTAPFEYLWSCSASVTNTASGLSAGTYWVQVTDANGCIDTLNFVIGEVPPLNLLITGITEPSCYGFSDGSAGISVSGGTTPYSYLWSTAPPQVTPTASGIPAGVYFVTVTDVNGCLEDMMVTVVQPTPVLIHPEVLADNLCFGDSSGVIAASGSGGTAPYTVFWNDFSVYADTLFDLPAGLYLVTVTDANGCSVDSLVKVVQFDSVYAAIVADTVICPGETLTLVVLTNDVFGLYDYQWSVNGLYMYTGSTFSWVVDTATLFTIALYSDAGCDPIFDTLFIQPIFIDPATLTLTATPDTLCLGNYASIGASVSDMTWITGCWWNFPALTGYGPHLVHPAEPTWYEITIANICGEELSKSILVNVHMPPTAEINTNPTQACDSVIVEFDFTANEDPYPLTDWLWTLLGDTYAVSSPSVVVFESTTINAQLSLTFSNGCTFDYSKMIGVTVFESPEADFYFNPDPAKEGEETEFVDISHGDPASWQWYMEGTLIAEVERPSWVFEETGTYTVTEIVIDDNGCSDTVTHSVNVIGDFLVYVPNAFTPDGSNYNNEFKPVMTNVSADGYEFLIFNRWGEIVFTTYNIEDSWDGTYHGDLVQDDVYVWKILVRDEQSERHQFEGHVAVLR